MADDIIRDEESGLSIRYIRQWDNTANSVTRIKWDFGFEACNDPYCAMCGGLLDSITDKTDGDS